jgi:hypothetical protein
MFALLASNTVHCISLDVNMKSGAIKCEVLSTLDSVSGILSLSLIVSCLVQLGHRSDIRCLALFDDGFSFVTGAMESASIWNRDSLRRVGLLEAEQMVDICSAMVVPGDKHCLLGTKVRIFCSISILLPCFSRANYFSSISPQMSS